MIDNRGRHSPLSKTEAYRRLHALKRGLGVASVIGFGVLGGLAFPHGARMPLSQAPGTTAETQPAVAPGDAGSAPPQNGVDAIGGFFSAVGSALFGQDGQGQARTGQGQNQTGQGQAQTGQGGYGFGSTSAGGAPMTGSGVS